MFDSSATLHGFAYGEHLDGPEQRSLGFRLLAPAGPMPWSTEVEALARGLQGTHFADQWPPVELFCSVLLADGQRLVAVARYGLADHTPTRRRSGLELVGVVGPARMDVPTALTIYRWLRQRRGDLHARGETYTLAEVLAAAPPHEAPPESVPVLPIRLWQEGTLLFVATAPSDPDRRLGLLEEGTSGAWQWLPLVGTDFPLASYAARGPLIAWTPHLSGVAVKLERSATEPLLPAPQLPRFVRPLAGLLVLLLLANLGATLYVSHRIPTTSDRQPTGSLPPSKPALSSGDASDREKFAVALYHLLQERGAVTAKDQAHLVRQYDRLVDEDPTLRVTTPQGQAAVAAVDGLARRGPGKVEAIVREALTGKGYDPELVNRACALVRDRLDNDKSR